MPAPKGHPNYNTSKNPYENGGYLGRGDDYYTDAELKALGEGLIKWIQEKNNIWLKFYFAPKGILWPSVQNLSNRSPMFKKYLDLAKEIQESKLCTDPYFKRADGNHARFMLARHHKGEWQDKEVVLDETNQLLKDISEEIKKGHNIVVEE
jgi:hypothetical protein